MGASARRLSIAGILRTPLPMAQQAAGDQAGPRTLSARPKGDAPHAVRNKHRDLARDRYSLNEDAALSAQFPEIGPLPFSPQNLMVGRVIICEEPKRAAPRRNRKYRETTKTDRMPAQPPPPPPSEHPASWQPSSTIAMRMFRQSTSEERPRHYPQEQAMTRYDAGGDGGMDV